MEKQLEKVLATAERIENRLARLAGVGEADITLPVRSVATSVYHTILDGEGRLITFIAMSERSKARTELIARAVNSLPVYEVAIEALKEVVKSAVEFQHADYTVMQIDEVTLDQARKALALVEGLNPNV
jgi:hypothetical protein